MCTHGALSILQRNDPGVRSENVVTDRPTDSNICRKDLTVVQIGRAHRVSGARRLLVQSRSRGVVSVLLSTLFHWAAECRTEGAHARHTAQRHQQRLLLLLPPPRPPPLFGCQVPHQQPKHHSNLQLCSAIQFATSARLALQLGEAIC